MKVPTVEYKAWHNMKQRCDTLNNPQYKDYRGRGISYCKEWKAFSNFQSDMGNKPIGFTLERKDNNQGHNKTNCVWASWLTQAKNKRTYENSTTKVCGVSWHKQRKKWYVSGQVNHVRKMLALTNSFEEAVQIRKKWEKENHFGLG